MWRKTDGKPSPEVSQPRAAAPLEPQDRVTVTPEPATATPPAATPAPRAPLAAASETIAPELPKALPSPGISRIHSGLRIHGEITGTSDLYIDGEIHGKLRLGGAGLVIGPSGKVQADIEAGAIVIEGFLEGSIKAREGVRLGAGSQVRGSMVTPRIGIEDGARLRGKVEMVRPGAPANSAEQTGRKPSTPTEELETARAVSATAKGQ